MTDFVILGTDTDAGKTTFAALWLAAFSDEYAYWKPLESGESDSERIRRLVPGAQVFAPLRHFAEPVAPMLAARRSGAPLSNTFGVAHPSQAQGVPRDEVQIREMIPPAAEIAAKRPHSDRSLIVETFGGPLSPLNESELQIELIRALGLPAVLVSSSAVGAVGRTLQCLKALEAFGVVPRAVVLMGERDEFAAEQIAKHGGIPVAADVRAVREALQANPGREAGGVKASDWLPHPRPHGRGSPRIVETDRDLIWHPYTSLRDPDDPLPVVGAEREFLHLADGRSVIDGISSWWTILHGHRHPPLVAALREALTHIDHVHFAGVTHPWAVELAEALLATAPWAGGRVFYSDNGSTAVEVALKMAYQFWQHRGEQRSLFVGLERGYHGDTFGAMAVGRDPLFFGRFEPLMFRTAAVPLDAHRLAETLSANRGRVAAVIVEPLVQGAGGMRMHSPDELRAMFEVTRAHDVLFIADEVMTGGGRTGSLWAHSAAGIAPDLICAAKTLAGGLLPLAVTLASPRIVEAWETDDRRRTFFHGHSFTAHPLACAVAAVNWRALPRGVNPQAARIESYWRTALEGLRDLPAVREVRVRGSIAAAELRAEGGYLADVGRQLRRSCLAAGVLLRPLGNVLYAMPPLNTSEESLARIAAAMTESIKSLPE